MVLCLKKESSSVCGKDMYKSEEESDEVTVSKEIEQPNTEIAVYENIAVWSWTCSGRLLVNLVTLTT